MTIRRLAPAYELRVENLTPDNGNGASQVFSPPVIASHERGFGIFRYGRRASDELAAIAEDAINGPMVDLLEASPKVTSVQQGDGVIFPGTEAVYEVEGDGSRLSMAFMLVNTNDGFSGVSSLRLPAGGRIAYYLPAWDAGSEVNTELMSDIPGPCCGSPEMGTPSHDRIRLHRGIRGHGDLDPDVYGWHGPAAKLTITRVR